jgi:hypothetical protein
MRWDSLLSHPGSCPADRVHLNPSHPAGRDVRHPFVSWPGMASEPSGAANRVCPTLLENPRVTRRIFPRPLSSMTGAAIQSQHDFQ